MKPSNIFGEVKQREGVVLTSVDFKYICLSRFINHIDNKCKSGEMSNYSLRTEVDNGLIGEEQECLFCTFTHNSGKIIIVFTYSEFRKHLVEKGVRRPSLVELDKELKLYVDELIEEQLVK